MLDTKSMIEGLMLAAIEATKAVVQAIAVVAANIGTGHRSEPVSIRPKLGSPTLKQPNFDWNFRAKYIDYGNLCNLTNFL